MTVSSPFSRMLYIPMETLKLSTTGSLYHCPHFITATKLMCGLIHFLYCLGRLTRRETVRIGSYFENNGQLTLLGIGKRRNLHRNELIWIELRQPKGIPFHKLLHLPQFVLFFGFGGHILSHFQTNEHRLALKVLLNSAHS